MKVIKPSVSATGTAAALLKKGGVIICPTDTVYGFLADAQNKKAVNKIYKIKKRPKSKPLSVFVKDLKMAKEMADINGQQEMRLRKYWPGKVTVVLKRKAGLKIYGVKKDTIAIRIPGHLFLQKLLKKIDRPLAQTSVNISTQEPLNSIDAILTTFSKNKLVGLIIDGGDIKNARASKIVDLKGKKLTRLR